MFRARYLTRLPMCCVTFLALSLPASGEVFPKPKDILGRFPAKMCFDLEVKTIKVDDLSRLPKVNIPACIDLTGLVEIPDNPEDICTLDPAFFTIQSIDSISALCTPLSLGEHFRYLVTPKLSFPVKVKNHQQFFLSKSLHSWSWLTVKAIWTYRLNLLLVAHKDDLPVRFASIILPSIDTVQETEITTSWETAGSEPRYNPKNLFNEVAAVAFDEENNEYEMWIDFELNELKFH